MYRTLILAAFLAMLAAGCRTTAHSSPCCGRPATPACSTCPPGAVAPPIAAPVPPPPFRG